MDVRINVETKTEAGEKRKQQIIRFNLPSQYHGDLGLKLEHSKKLLAQLQLAIIQHQIEEISDASRNCPCVAWHLTVIMRRFCTFLAVNHENFTFEFSD